jgi:hypothetical protein
MAAPILVKSQCLSLFAKQISCLEMQLLISGIGNTIWWVIMQKDGRRNSSKLSNKIWSFENDFV